MGRDLQEAWLEMSEKTRDQFRAFMRGCFVAGGLHGIGWAIDTDAGQTSQGAGEP